MKLATGLYFLIFLLSKNVYAQPEVVYNSHIISSNGTLLENSALLPLQAYSNMDLDIDSTGSIYITNYYDNKIIKLDVEGNLIQEISFDQNIVLTNHHLVQMELDANNNIYLLLQRGEFFESLFKYSQIQNKWEKISLNNLVMERIISFRIFYGKFIFFNTFPSSINPQYIEDGKVFIYNLSGEYLGRSNYEILDDKNNAYCFASGVGSKLYKRYEVLSSDIGKLNSKVENGVIKLKNENTDVSFSLSNPWKFCGLDKENNLYFANYNRILQINNNLQISREISFESEGFENKGIRIQPHLIKISKNGNVFGLGLSVANYSRISNSTERINNVKFNLIQFK